MCNCIWCARESLENGCGHAQVHEVHEPQTTSCPRSVHATLHTHIPTRMPPTRTVPRQLPDPSDGRIPTRHLRTLHIPGHDGALHWQRRPASDVAHETGTHIVKPASFLTVVAMLSIGNGRLELSERMARLICAVHILHPPMQSSPRRLTATRGFHAQTSEIGTLCSVAIEGVHQPKHHIRDAQSQTCAHSTYYPATLAHIGTWPPCSHAEGCVE